MRPPHAPAAGRASGRAGFVAVAVAVFSLGLALGTAAPVAQAAPASSSPSSTSASPEAAPAASAASSAASRHGWPGAAGAVVGGTAAMPLRSCRLPGLTHDALCGELPRPLDPSQPQGRQIRLRVAVLPAVARQKRPDPVYLLAGGPGQSAISLAGVADRMLGRLNARRDIVLVDQRGTGYSAPLGCDRPDAATMRKALSDPTLNVQLMAACRRQLQQLPWGDLRQFTTTIAMADLDAVRAALGHERINVVGGSYGTRAGLEYLRQYPTHVRRMVLDGVAPPDMVLPASNGLDSDAALDALLADCRADVRCNKAFPDLQARWQGLLQQPPRDVTATDPASGLPVTVHLDTPTLQGLVRPALYLPALSALLPQAITRAADGDLSTLLAMGGSLGSSGNLYEGMHFSVICAEDHPRLLDGSATIPGAQDPRTRLYRGICADWPHGTVPADFYRVPVSPVPVLLLSGGNDPVTPPRHAQRVARQLGPMARHLVVPHASHGVMSLPCVRDGLFRYLDAPTDAQAQAADVASCAAGIPRPLAFVPPQPPRAASAVNLEAGTPSAAGARP